LDLEPAVLKNSKSVAPIRSKTTGKMAFIPFMSKKARRFMTAAKKQLEAQEMPSEPISCPVVMKCLLFGPWEPDSESVPDLSNLYQAVEDILEDTGVLKNDRLICGHDGSRRIPLCGGCPLKPIIRAGKRKGQPKDSCGRKKTCPRTCILVWLIPFEEQTKELLEQHPEQKKESLI